MLHTQENQEDWIIGHSALNKIVINEKHIRKKVLKIKISNLNALKNID